MPLLRNEYVLACNLMFSHPDFIHLNPLAYFELDAAWRVLASKDLFYKSGTYYRQMGEWARRKAFPLFVAVDSAMKFHREGYFKGVEVFYLKSKSSMLSTRNLSNDLAGNFTFCDGVVFAMVASAIYMGFSEIVLCGCDYTFSPRQSGHFYEDWVKCEDVDVDPRHMLLHEFAKNKGVRILNVVPDRFHSPIYESVRPSGFVDLLGNNKDIDLS